MTKCLKTRLRKRDDVDCVRASYRIELLEKALREAIQERINTLEEEADILAPYMILLAEENDEADTDRQAEN